MLWALHLHLHARSLSLVPSILLQNTPYRWLLLIGWGLPPDTAWAADDRSTHHSQIWRQMMLFETKLTVWELAGPCRESILVTDTYLILMIYVLPACWQERWDGLGERLGGSGKEFLTQSCCPAVFTGGGRWYAVEGVRASLGSTTNSAGHPLPHPFLVPLESSTTYHDISTSFLPLWSQLLRVIGAEREYPVLIGLSTHSTWRLAAAVQGLPACLSGRLSACWLALPLEASHKGVTRGSARFKQCSTCTRMPDQSSEFSQSFRRKLASGSFQWEQTAIPDCCGVLKCRATMWWTS